MKAKKGRKGFLAFKVDLEKTYDRIKWPFLEDILIAIGFQPHLVKLMMYYTSSTQLSLIWNGEKLSGFEPQRGLRHPLLHYLFVL